MSRPEFENQTSISAVTSKKIKSFKSNANTQLAKQTFERHTFFSAPNTVSSIMNLNMGMRPIGAGITGIRTMFVDTYIGPSEGLGVLQATSGIPQNDFMFDQGTFKNGGTQDTSNITFIPNDIGAVNANLRAIKYDDTIGVSFVFYHDTTASTIGEERWVTWFVEEETVKR